MTTRTTALLVAFALASLLPIVLVPALAASGKAAPDKAAPDKTASDKAASGPVPGDLWEMTNQMSMNGAPLQIPSMTQKLCRPKGKTWDSPPTDKSHEDLCKVSGYTMTGNHAAWKMSCKDGASSIHLTGGKYYE